MEKIWHHSLYSEIRELPDEHLILMTEKPQNPKINREKMMEIMFESFKVPKFSVQMQAVLSLYASGKTTGIVVDSGDSVTHVVPIFQGYSLPQSILKSKIAGNAITYNLRKILSETGIDFKFSSGLEVVRDIKEKCCYIAYDYEKEKQSFIEDTSKNQDYYLPSSYTIKLKDQSCRAPEIIFKPNLIQSQELGVHELIFNSIEKSNIDIKNELFANIILSGGSTLFAGYQQRLNKEIQTIYKGDKLIKIEENPNRILLPWLGGSMITSLSTFKDKWVTQEEYYEFGSDIIHSKCF